MSEVKNEGLEVVANFDGLYLVPLVVMAAGTELCRHSEALAGYAVRDARIAELERLAVAISADCNDMANERNQLRAELAALTAKLDASKFCANVADGLRAELDAIKAQEPVAYIPVDRVTGDKWPPVYSKGNGKICDYAPLYAAPVAKQVVMPERDKLECLLDEVCGTNGTIPTDEPIYSISLSEVAEVIRRLNAADQEGGQDE